MKVATLCALLLVTMTSVWCDDGAIRVTNNGNYKVKIGLYYELERGMWWWKKDLKGEDALILNAGETSSIRIPEAAKNIDVKAFTRYESEEGQRQKHQFVLGAFPQPVKMCFRIWDVAEQPQYEKISC